MYIRGPVGLFLILAVSDCVDTSFINSALLFIYRCRHPVCHVCHRGSALFGEPNKVPASNKLRCFAELDVFVTPLKFLNKNFVIKTFNC